MVFSQISQPNSTYLTWTKFAFPHEDHGPVPAIAVPIAMYRYIQSGYTMMSTLIVINITAIFIAGGLCIYLKSSRTGNKVNDISMSLWNKRESTHLSVVDTLFYSRDALKKWWYYPLVAALLSAWIASLLAGILLPPTVFLGNAAPVRTGSIYVPPDLSKDDGGPIDESVIFGTHLLQLEPYIRAAGAAYIATDRLRSKVKVEGPIPLGTWRGSDPLDPKTPRTEPIQRINYGYNVTGADLGLQKLPKLRLSIAGSCITEYNWYQGVGSVPANSSSSPTEKYWLPLRQPNGKLEEVNSLCPAPSAKFRAEAPIRPASERGNVSWAIIVSSFDRKSYLKNEDPWYRTKEVREGNQTFHKVLRGRPALSCWQSDTWFFADEGPEKSSTILNLQAMVGKEKLSDAMVEILRRYFTLPVAYNLGFALQGSALQSAKAVIASRFDARDSSMYKDLYYIILSAYIATINTLTDTTLYLQPDIDGSPPKIDIPNLALDNTTRHPRPGIEDFVVFSDQVATLSLTRVILIPVLTLGSWLLMHMMLGLTPLKIAAAMESIELFQAVRQHYGEPTVHMADDGIPKWKL